MLSVSQQFKDAFRDPRRVVEFRAIVNGVEYTKSQIVDLSIRDDIQPSSAFMLGTVASSELTLSLRTPDEIPINAEVRLYIRAAELTWDMVTLTWAAADTPWNDASTESVPYGVYYIDSRRQIGSYWQYTCYDKLILAELPYISGLTYPATMAAVLAEACGQAGIEYEAVVSPSLTFAVAPTGYTCRQVIGLVAQACAACTRINKVGKLVFVSFGGAPVETIQTGEYRKLTHTNPAKSISRVVCVVDDEGATLEAGTGGADNTVSINNPYLNQAAVNGVQSALNGFTYHPFTMDWICLPWMEVGDRVRMQEYVSGSWNTTATRWNETEIPWNGIMTFDTTIMTNTIKYRGGLTATISASSDSQQQSEFKPVGTIAQQIQRLNQGAVKFGKPFFGVTFTKEEGFRVQRSDGKSELMLNSDVMDWKVNGQSSLYFDAQAGKLKYRGDIVMQGGSISWEHVNAPTPNDVGALPANSSKISNLSDIGVYLGALQQGQVTGLSTRLTKITDTGVYTGTLGTDQLVAGSALIGNALIDKIRANQIDVATGKIQAAQIETLIVGSNVQMGAGASISWDQVTDKNLDYTAITGTKPPASADNTATAIGADRLTKITSTGIYTGTIDASQVNTVGLAAERIYQQGTPSNYMSVGGTYGDMVLYYGGSEYFRIENASLGSMRFKNRTESFLGHTTGVGASAHGAWNFGNATVSGLNIPARFS